jgi:Lantibiotic biosynthesis dehydratase C-term
MTEGYRSKGDTHNWSWLRVYYFAECKDDLILDGVWPAVQVAGLDESECQAYFQRDWLGGPNILLGLRGTSSQPHVLRVAEQIRDYVRARPSAGQLSASQLAQAAESLGRWEGKPNGASVALQPNNSVLIESSEPYSLFLRQDLLKEAVREFLSRSSEFTVDWLRSIRAGAWQRQYIALQLMIALAWIADPKKLRSHYSFSSHAAGFLRASDSHGRVKNSFSERYQGRDGETVRNVLRTSVDALESGNSSIPRLDAFVALLSHTLSDFCHGLREKRYQPSPAKEFVGAALQDPKAFRRMTEILDHNPAWRAWQITISLLYQTLNQLGIKPIERFLACYLLSRAAEDVYGESVESIAEEIDRSGEHAAIFSFFSEEDSSVGKVSTTHFQSQGMM